MRLPGDDSVSVGGNMSRPVMHSKSMVKMMERAIRANIRVTDIRSRPATVASDAGGVTLSGDGIMTTSVARKEKEERRYCKVQLLCASDGTVFDVTPEEAMMSSMMWMLVQDDGGGRGKKSTIRQHTIPINDVPSSSVELALYYCRCLHKQEIEEDDSAMDEFDSLFYQLDSKILCDLAKVASNLDIQPLVDITCRSIAQIMSASDAAQEIRQKFGLEDGPGMELRSGISGVDLTLFNSLEHELSTEDYQLVEFDQPSVDELVNFINGDSGKPKKSRATKSQGSSIDGGVADSTASSGGKKKKKKKKSKKKTSNSNSNDDDDADADADADGNVKAPLSAAELQEKMLLAQQNLSAVFPESEFEDDEDEELEEQLESFRQALESAHLESKQAKLKPCVNFTPRDVFRNRLQRTAATS